MQATGRGSLFEVGAGVLGIDLAFMGRPHLIASYVLLGEGGRFALVETGPESTHPALLAGLAQADLELRRLEAIVVTHIHLDHAGACGLLAREVGCPIYVHEVGLPHLAEPSRLWASTQRTFGPDAHRLWKGVTPVPRHQLRPLGDGDTLQLAGRRVQVFHTPGHASHHVALLVDGEVLFTGDAAGVRLPELPYVRPPTVPPELDLEAWEATLDRLGGLRARWLVPTHFGAYPAREMAWHLQSLRGRLRRWADVVLEGLRAGLDEADLVERLIRHEDAELQQLGIGTGHRQVLELATPGPVAVRGLQRYWQKTHPERIGPLPTG